MQTAEEIEAHATDEGFTPLQKAKHLLLKGSPVQMKSVSDRNIMYQYISSDQIIEHLELYMTGEDNIEANKQLIPIIAEKLEQCDEDYLATICESLRRTAQVGVSYFKFARFQLLIESAVDLLMSICLDYLDTMGNQIVRAWMFCYHRWQTYDAWIVTFPVLAS